MARVWIGTSGFSYKEWKGPFYPSDIPADRMLSYYATRFRSVEIDSTFYRMPSVKSIEGWQSATPESFRFTIKAPQQITHRQRLKVPSDALNHLASVVTLLGDRLGMLLYQLPPFFKCDMERLAAFLQVLPASTPSALEFRHESWFVPEVYALLEEYGVTLCVHDSDDGCSPMPITARSVCVRLRRTQYSAEQRQEWREHFRSWAENGVEVFAYIKHKDNPDAPKIALDFAEGF